jgi:hypothetical protein
MKKDVREKRIYHTVPGSKGTIHHMEYNIVLGWMCSCKSYMYRKSCKHVIMMNEMMNEYGSCTECDNRDWEISKVFLCSLWEITIDEPASFNCAGWKKI